MGEDFQKIFPRGFFVGISDCKGREIRTDETPSASVFLWNAFYGTFESICAFGAFYMGECYVCEDPVEPLQGFDF